MFQNKKYIANGNTHCRFNIFYKVRNFSHNFLKVTVLSLTLVNDDSFSELRVTLFDINILGGGYTNKKTISTIIPRRKV